MTPLNLTGIDRCDDCDQRFVRKTERGFRCLDHYQTDKNETTR